MLSRRSILRTATGVSSTVVLSRVCRRISCSFKNSNRKVYLTVIFSATSFSAVLPCAKTQVHGNDVLDSPELPGYVIEHWKREFAVLESEIQEKRRLYEAGKDPYETDRILDRQSCILPGDRTPFSVEYRRTRALIKRMIEDFGVGSFARYVRELESLRGTVQACDSGIAGRSRTEAMHDYFEVAALRRQVALSNPLVDFDQLLFAGRGNYFGDDPTGQHQLSGPIAFCNRVGGGLYILQDLKTNAQVIDLIEHSVVENGSYKGWKLSGKGSFYSPELSFDGRTILFSWSENRIGRERAGWGLGEVGPIHKWPSENVWHIFKVNIDGSHLTQLTEGPWNDFDPCFLPSGRIVFVSERRGGYIRCFRETLFMEPTTYVMFSMNDDGSDVSPLSYFEASEWAPSVDNDGMLIYSRWDYIDRENGLGSKFWTCFPDGRNPRAPHGNYPHPYSVQPEYTGPKQGTRPLGACSEVHFRAIPNSSRYIFTGVPHHGASFGPLALLDLRVPDRGTMNQVTKITADQRFPESQTREGIETDDRILKYGTPWPLSEDFYICNYQQNLILLDRFGTKTILCSHSQCPNIGETMRPVEPIPVKPRQTPPNIPISTFNGQRENTPHSPAVIGVIDVHASDISFPEDRPAKWLRIVQLFPKTTPHRDVPGIGYGNEGIPRMSLGIVPVESDGSVYCRAPVGKQLLFQALDGNMMAIQSMRSVTYVHPGERLTCVGCHENGRQAPYASEPPQAFQRPPSELLKEPGSQEPVTYYRTVQPIFQGKCLPCHHAENKGPQEMSYDNLEEYAFHFSGAHMNNYSNLRLTGMGTRSIPGLVGAHYSKMGGAMLESHRDNVGVSRASGTTSQTNPDCSWPLKSPTGHARSRCRWASSEALPRAGRGARHRSA